MFVIVIPNSPQYWDDGVLEVFGPFDTHSQAEQCALNNRFECFDIFPLTSLSF